MKNIFLSISLLLLSCSSDKVEISKDEYNKLKGIVKSEYPKRFHFKDAELDTRDWHIDLGDDNHEYLRNYVGHGLVLIHYPDCKKCIKKDSQNIK